MLQIVGLRFEFFPMDVAVPYAAMLILVIDPVLPQPVNPVGISAILVRAVIRLKVMGLVYSTYRSSSSSSSLNKSMVLTATCQE